MIKPVLAKNDRKARVFIYVVSAIVFLAVAALGRTQLTVKMPFNVHVFALISAITNSVVALLLIAGLFTIKNNRPLLHKKIMLAAITLSILFLVSYVAHHLLASSTRFGDVNHDGILSPEEKSAAGQVRYIYYFLLLTHIPLAAVILPFILFTAYRALTGEYEKHRKLARITWPVWFYVAVSGVVIYLMIRPYY